MMSLFVFSLFGMVIDSASAYGFDYGNKQYYTVYLDDEGEASVFAKFVLVNTGDEKMDSLQLELQGDATVLNVVQEVELRRESDNYRGYYTEIVYYDVDFVVDKLSQSSVVELLNLETVDENEELVLLVTYKQDNVADLSLGVWDFEFETAKWNYDTSYIKVSSNVANGLFLKGIESEQNYETGAVFAKSVSEESAAFASEDLEDYSRSIEYSYGHTEEGYAFDAQESFSVTGNYSKSEFLLNLWKNVAGIGLGLLLVSLLTIGVSRGFRTLGAKKNKASSEIIVVGLLSSVSVALIGGLGIWMISKLHEYLGYNLADLFGLVLGILLFVFGIFAIVVPAVYLGKKHKDYLIGLWSAGVTIGSLLLISLLGIIVLALLV